MHRRKGYQIPESGRTARGTAVVNVLPLEPEEKVTAMLLTRTMEEERYLTFVTRRGTVKRLELSLLNTARKAGIRALSLDEGDELVAVLSTGGNDNIILASHDGMAICFSETDVRPTGRTAGGVKGIALRKGDICIGAAVASLAQPIFDNGRIRAKYKVSKAEMEIATNDFKQAVIKAGNEVNLAMDDIYVSRLMQELIDKQVESLSKALDATQKLYQNTGTNYLNVITAQNSLLTAQMSQISNRMDAISATISLYQALGGGAE